MSQSTSMATPISDSIKDEIRKSQWGSFLNAGSPADRAEAQRIGRQESRLGIPLLFGRDVIHGYHTIFPIPLGQAASWDPDLMERAARIAAREASAEGIRWAFAPMVDVARDPRWGRIAESPGEDPYVGQVAAAAIVRGFQGASLRGPSSVAASVKHFAGYGAAEAGRDCNSAWIPESVLRDVYLPPFYAAIDAGAATIMTAFNALNGVPATGNQFLIRDVLRGEWKKGFRRISLRAGETQKVSFTLHAAELRFHNQQMKLVSEPGQYQVWIAPDSIRGLEGQFALR